MINLLKKLTTFQTDKDHPEEIKRCLDFVVNDLKKAGLKVKTYSFDNKPSIIAAKSLKKHYQYILNGHLDVVPATYPKAFEPIIKGSRLYARGASDMKGPDAALIELMKDKELKNIDCALMLTFDEETGGFDGVKCLLTKEKYTCDCAIIPDAGNNFKLITAEKGIMHVRLTAQGIAAHGSHPWDGNNALEKLIVVFEEIKSKIPATKPGNRWLPTINLGKLAGGDSANKVPSQAEMLLDFRFPLSSQKIKITSWLKKAIAKHKGVIYKIISSGEPLNVPVNNKYVQKIIRIAEDQQIDMKIGHCHGASDARFFADKNIPAIMFKPNSGPAHTDNEWIDLKSLNKFYLLLKAFLLSRC